MRRDESSQPTERPPRVALVLSGGGARAAYQVGLLRYLGKAMPDFHFRIVVGTSAGALNAVYLASHAGSMAQAADALSALWSNLTFDRVFETDSLRLGRTVGRWGLQLLSGGSKLAPGVRALLDTAPLARLLEEVLATSSGEVIGIGENIERDRLDAVALTTLNYATGQTVTWVQGDRIQTWERPHRRALPARIGIDHIMASAALPIIFPAVRLGTSWYGDGGVRLSAPLAPAVHLGADRLIAISTRYPRSQTEADQPLIAGYPPTAQVLGAVLNAIFLDVVEQDAMTLKRINRLLEKLPEEQHGALRPVDITVLQPSRDLGKLAAAFETRLPKAFRFLTRGLGTRETLSPDFLSLLMFHPDYLRELIAIGEADAEAAKDRLVAMVSP